LSSQQSALFRIGISDASTEKKSLSQRNMKETNVATKLAAKDSEGEEASEEEALENSDISFKLMETVLMSGQEIFFKYIDPRVNLQGKIKFLKNYSTHFSLVKKFRG